ncbi:ABC transporter ATP-binding protein [Bacillus sp. NEB1478]|uniref:ABC transporter ATP-binding protein n=1 Tax=Bacillus sp. NEB1478 TaxID=3073816 RepID=UPI002873965F|nr:ABC transporter ATP-binding protein [Bacillus sp. NEB1478]WNB92478.1 ABC transporter ATP-binding protein [Bacillus sp. NEB1478]
MISKIRGLFHAIKPYLSMKDVLRTFRLVAPFIRKYWKSYVVLFILLGVDIASILGFAWFFGNIADAAVHADLEQIKDLAFIGIMLTSISIGSNFLSIYCDMVATNAIKKDLKNHLLNHILRLPEASTSKVHSGELLSHFTNDIHSIDGLIGSSLINFIKLPLIYVAVFIYLIKINWVLCLLSMMIAPVAMISSIGIGMLLRRNSRLIHDLYAQINSILNEIFQGLPVIRSFLMEKSFYEKHTHKNEQLYRLELQNAKLQGWFSSGGQLVSSLSYLISISLGAYFVSVKVMTVGALLTFINLVHHLVYPLTDIASKWAGFQHSISALERIFRILELPPDSNELPSFHQSFDKGTSITLNKVTFSYEENISVFRDFSIEIPANKTIALVGPSGAGKSTLFNLLQGFYKPESGKILLNGVSTEKLSIAELRSAISYVPQETYLFAGTIRENLLLARSGITDNELITAAKSAYIHNFICSLPEGYDTEIGERGIKLSGGQKQRIAIARAILKDTPILLLDEATSALDNETEHHVQKALKQLMKGRTTIIIAHRLSTIQDSDLIMVLDKGEIVQSGTHQELIEAKGLYRKLQGKPLNNRLKVYEGNYVKGENLPWINP